MADFKEMLKYYRKREGLSQAELAKVLDLSPSTISMYEVGEREPSFEIEEKIADYFNVNLNTLRGRDSENKDIYSMYDLLLTETRTLPILGEVACGEPILTNEEVEYVTLKDVPEQADFILIAKGDSMKNSRIYDGDYVFIHKQSSVQNGDIAVVIINDEATLKRVFFYPETNKLVLQPSNDDYEPLVYIGEELRNVRIIGKAIAFQGVL